MLVHSPKQQTFRFKKEKEEMQEKKRERKRHRCTRPQSVREKLE